MSVEDLDMSLSCARHTTVNVDTFENCKMKVRLHWISANSVISLKLAMEVTFLSLCRNTHLQRLTYRALDPRGEYGETNEADPIARSKAQQCVSALLKHQ